ncbi:MAG: hypothetical protein AAB381_00090 [Patescibacteria group bacterium]
MSPETITTNNVPLVYPPSVDFFSFGEKVVQWIVDIYPNLFGSLQSATGLLVGISIPVSILLIIMIIYSVEQIKKIRLKEAEIYDLKVEPAYTTVERIVEAGAEEVPVQNDMVLAQRWDVIGQHINSENPNDWKQAILDADTILDDVLTRLGYRGESVGEKLKRAEPADFATLQDAWEAHKARNDIAHRGLEYTLNQHEAKRIFQLYRKVFEEFYYI